MGNVEGSETRTIGGGANSASYMLYFFFGLRIKFVTNRVLAMNLPKRKLKTLRHISSDLYEVTIPKPKAFRAMA
jgi:hypothetical protein